MSNDWCVGYGDDPKYVLFGWWDTDYSKFVDTETAEKLLEVKITEPDSGHSRVNLIPLYRKI